VTVSLDKGALYALLDADDDGHDRAVRGRDAIGDDNFVTHGYVVAETISLVRRRLGAAAAVRVIDEFLPALDIVDVEGEVREAATRAFRAAVRSSVSFVDQTSFVFMRDKEIVRVWALDADFATAGFDLVA
jgi:predicted nucleic acid-binding protein